MKKQNTRATEGGQVMLVAALFILAGSLMIASGALALVRDRVQVSNEHNLGILSYIYSEGAAEEVAYRHMNSMTVTATENLSDGGMTATTVTTPFLGGYNITSTGDVASRNRSVEVVVIQGERVSFRFGVQTSDGGLVMRNGSSVIGDIFSNGPIVGRTGAALSDIDGSVISAGPAGSIEDIQMTGDGYAHTIDDSHVEGDAYYQLLTDTIVDGATSTSPDMATMTLPIADTMIDAWKEYASSTEVWDAECASSSGTITISSDTTLGPVKIPCDVEFTGNNIDITIEGVLWIVGNLNISLSPRFHVAAAIGNRSVPIIVDDPSDRENSSQIVMQNSGEWFGNGNRSYLLLISQNESAENGNSNNAVEIQQSTGGDVLVYAGHGQILLTNSSGVTMLTAWRVRLQNNITVTLDNDLSAAIFEVGPDPGYVVDEWKEVE